MDGLDRGADDRGVDDLSVAVRTSRGLQRHWLFATLLILGAALRAVVIGYLGWFDASHGEWNFTTFSGAFLYGRVADFASCQGLNLPAYEKPLCPTQPAALRNADFYEWNPQSPQWTFHPPAGMSRDTVVRDFSLRILHHQPLAYAAAAARDFLYGFSPVRGAGPEKYSPAYLQFQTYVRPDRQAYASIAALGYPAPAVRPGLAAFLTDYGRWFYVPGPVFAAGLVLGLGGLVTASPARREQGQARREQGQARREQGQARREQGQARREQGQARREQGQARREQGQVRRKPDKRIWAAGLLFTASAVLVLILLAASATFDWRYQLPQLSLIPVAAVLGLTAIGRRAALADGDKRPRPLAVRLGPVGRAGAAGAHRGRLPPGAALH